ncbi:MAG: SUMF1/EgtB/PvdO family nonheme iron enzyme [Blastocatellia bacterium]|nr:SUMF1/EgtB/PvdO family nonheme iron enzyme [Blastocatellia bacterium]
MPFYTPPEHWKGNNFPINTEDYPVTKVSWEDANNYCKWRSKKMEFLTVYQQKKNGNMLHGATLIIIFLGEIFGKKV